MKKKYYVFLIAFLILLPMNVFAKSNSGSDVTEISAQTALFIEAFTTAHISIFFFAPVSKLISKKYSKIIFWILFIIRVLIYLYCDFFVTPLIFLFDFLLCFIAILIGNFAMPILTSNSNTDIDDTTIEETPKVEDADKSDNNKQITTISNTDDSTSLLVKPENFDSIYSLSDNLFIKSIIEKEFKNCNIDYNEENIPIEVLKRKNLLNIIFAILLFCYISLLFFHLPKVYYIVGIIILIAYYFITQKYDTFSYVKKQFKSRPEENITNIIMNMKSTFVKSNIKLVRKISIALAVVIPVIIFLNPIILYEQLDNGYSVRFYTYGLMNFNTAKIPSTHNGKPVISLRGNLFSDMYLLEEVVLPDSITEIRGQAFKNDVNLTNVNMPNKLEYLGGSAFYNCQKLTSIKLPNTLTYMGGETFYGAKSLTEVVLSNKLTEIRGNTFENCTSLRKIVIPDEVARIGSHAFYGDISLTNVEISSESKLYTIGSSAFRKCYNLNQITLPNKVMIANNSFKESPTSIYWHLDY